jgi:hypothetical protein
MVFVGSKEKSPREKQPVTTKIKRSIEGWEQHIQDSRKEGERR